MREALESYVLVFGIGAVVAVGAKRIGVPYNVALVVIGLLLVFADVLPHAQLDPEVVLVAFLPILVFEASLFADADSLRNEARGNQAIADDGQSIAACWINWPAVARHELCSFGPPEAIWLIQKRTRSD